MSIGFAIMLHFPAHAASHSKLSFTGIALFEHDNAAKNSQTFVSQIPLNQLEAEFKKRMALNRPWAHLANKVDHANQPDVISLSVAIVLTGESLTQQNYGNGFVATTTVNASIILFNDQTGQLVAAFPLQTRYSTPNSQILSEDEQRALFRNLYFKDAVASDGRNINILEIWLDRLNSLNIQEKYTYFLQIDQFNLSRTARAALAENKVSEDVFRHQMLLFLESSISANGTPVIPSQFLIDPKGEVTLQYPNEVRRTLAVPRSLHRIPFRIDSFSNWNTQKDVDSAPDSFRDLATIQLFIPGALPSELPYVGAANSLVIRTSGPNTFSLNVYPQYSMARATMGNHRLNRRGIWWAIPSYKGRTFKLDFVGNTPPRLGIIKLLH